MGQLMVGKAAWPELVGLWPQCLGQSARFGSEKKTENHETARERAVQGERERAQLKHAEVRQFSSCPRRRHR